MSDLDIGVLNSDRNYSGLVDSSDPFDLYKFSLNSPGKVGVSLTGLTANADLEVLDNSDKVLYNAANVDLNDEVIAIDNLAAGNYTIRVNQVSGEANYNLSLTVEEIEKLQVDPITGLNIESGYFTVGETGQVGVDFINDGGGYKGELAIFSLDGIDQLVPGSEEFIKEAAKRSLTNSNLGYVIISDTNEAAKFNVGLPNADNDGEYKKVKTFAMKPGDTFGVMLVPNGKVEEVFDNPNIGGNKRPLFSLVTANPNEAFHLGQVADINGTGSAFAIEDQRVDTGTDKDYNDVIFKLTGATGKAVNLDDVIDPGKDWRNSKLGKDLIDYVKKEELAIDPKPPIDSTPVDPKPPIDSTPVDPKPPVDTTPIDPKPPIDNTPIDPKPPIDSTPVDPKPPIDSTPVDPKPPVDTTPIDPKPPVDTTPIDPKPPVDTTPVDPTPPVDTTPVDKTKEDWREFETGIFTVGETGEVSLDFLYDGSSYQGQLAIFSLEGMENFKYGSNAFIQEAAIRSISNSQLGHLIISDSTDAARFYSQENSGEYQGIKTVSMRPGDKFGVMFVSSGKVQQVLENPANGVFSPLFSLSSSQSQIADITGSGNAFAMEEQQEIGSDRDYNDIIFQVQGATGKAPLLEQVINQSQDWRNSELGQALQGYVKFKASAGAIADTLPDTVQYAIHRAENLENYDPFALAATTKWVIGVSTGQSASQLATLFNVTNLGATGHIPNTYVWEFSNSLTQAQVQKRLSFLGGVEFAYPLVPYQQQKRFIPNDPLFGNQWHLQNTGQTGGTAGADANIISAWNTVRGTGVTIGIVDDGLQYTHPDLQANYRADLSRDFNEIVGPLNIYDSDPLPNIWESHGTSSAGVAAARGNNGTGVSGAAPNAFLAGLRLTAASTTDLNEADALSYLDDDIDIYNNSWGPSDDGQTLQGPNPLTASVLHTGATLGRGGLGNIYVWSGGNGQQAKDNVNYDGYANSRYTIAVGAIDHNGKQSFYSEPGAPLLVSAYSSGSASGITTSDLVGADGEDAGDYTSSFGGTSAAAPLVSGVVALMLEANPTLTWRDVQHILVQTAKKNDPTDLDWKVNGAGRNINHKYGFGAIDAAAAVSAATTWKPVGTEFSVSSGLINVNGAIPDNNGTSYTSTVTITQDITIEKLEVMFDAQHPLRGDLDVRLISPDGTESILAERHNDTGDNYDKWVFTSARHWGESSKGDWKLRVTDRRTGNTGTWNSWKLNLYGTKPTVSISATDANATEGGDAGEFTVTRTGNTKNPLTVNYEFGGGIHWSEPPGTNGTDYEYLPGSITIPAGASFVKIPIISKEDTETEWTETVKLNLLQNNGYEVSSANTDTVKIWDNEKSRVQLYTEWSAGIPSNFHQANYTSESGNTGSFIFRRLGNITEGLTVNYTMTGTATFGIDYQALPGSVTFAPGQWDIWLPNYFTPIDDNEIEGEETAILTINPSSDYNILNDWGSRTNTIWDNDNKPTVTITATDPTASEYGDKGQFTITRTGDTSNPLTVNYWEREWWLKAVPGQDYNQPIGSTITGTTLDGSITIPAGASSVTIDINPIDDNVVEPDNERVKLYLQASTEYILGAAELAEVSIQDNDSPKVDWKRQLGTSGYDYSNGVAVDNASNVYITGRTSGALAGTNSGTYDAWVSKYNNSGSLLWKQQIGTPGYDAANGVAVDSIGNTYITGWTDGSFNNTNANRDAWLAKYDPSGNQVWKKQLGVAATSTSTGYDIANGAVTLGSDGSVYIAGRTFGNLGGTNQGEADAWVAKYDSNGDQNWVKQLGTSAWDEANGAAVDSAGNVYITGHTKGALGGTFAGDVDAWVAKYDGSGNQLWKQQLGTMAEDAASSVAVSSNGNLYISGHTKSKLGDAFTGNAFEWGENNVVWAAIHGDTSGLGGTYYGNADAWVAQLNSINGNLKWKRQLGTANYDSASGVATDSFGNVYITGRTRGKLAQTQLGGDDAWVAKYNINGALQWRQQLGTVGEDVSNGIAVSSTGIYITGATSGSLDGTNQGGDDAWVIKLA